MEREIWLPYDVALASMDFKLLLIIAFVFNLIAFGLAVVATQRSTMSIQIQILQLSLVFSLSALFLLLLQVFIQNKNLSLSSMMYFINGFLKNRSIIAGVKHRE